MKFAVVILTKNRDVYLKEALKSACKQKLKPSLIIIIDNAGLAKTKNIVKKIVPKKQKYFYKPITNINNVAKLRNIASKMVSADYIAFLDDDDYFDKNYLYKVNKDLKKNKHDVIITNIKRVDGKIKSKFTYFNDKTSFRIKDFLNKNPGTLCSNLIVKKKTFIKLGGFDKNVSGSCDKDLVMKFIIKDKNIFYNEKYHVFYRMHRNQWSRLPIKVISQRIFFYRKYFKFFGLYDHFKFLTIVLNIIIRIFYDKLRYNSI
tara:strand:+ start:1324 stop:2103 length:780 start_codon:yes stop_codon:yes gene_type:complete